MDATKRFAFRGGPKTRARRRGGGSSSCAPVVYVAARRRPRGRARRRPRRARRSCSSCSERSSASPSCCRSGSRFVGVEYGIYLALGDDTVKLGVPLHRRRAARLRGARATRRSSRRSCPLRCRCGQSGPSGRLCSSSAAPLCRRSCSSSSVADLGDTAGLRLIGLAAAIGAVALLAFLARSGRLTSDHAPTLILATVGPGAQLSTAAAETATEPILRCSEVRKSFGDNLVLDGIDLTVDTGEVLVVIGGERQRQEHAAALHQPARAARQRPHLPRGRRDHRARA